MLHMFLLVFVNTIFLFLVLFDSKVYLGFISYFGSVDLSPTGLAHQSNAFLQIVGYFTVVVSVSVFFVVFHMFVVSLLFPSRHLR